MTGYVYTHADGACYIDPQGTAEHTGPEHFGPFVTADDARAYLRGGDVRFAATDENGEALSPLRYADA